MKAELIDPPPQPVPPKQVQLTMSLASARRLLRFATIHKVGMERFGRTTNSTYPVVVELYEALSEVA